MDNKKIGSFIAERRKKKGLTQEELGEKLGVSNKTISRWENGNYMPDLSLLEPLSKELEISLNELLAGEIIAEDKTVEYSEQNLISTIDYSNKKIKDEHKKISLLIMSTGILICIYAFKTSWGSIFSLIGLFMIAIGVFRELKFSFLKRFLISICVFIMLLSILFVADCIIATWFKHAPIYSYKTTTVFNGRTKIAEYRNPFFNVYRINADTANEYYFVDYNKRYDVDTVPTSPFNQDISAIENLLQYQSKYIGNNSNTGHLIGALPLSEYGYVFEIDSENCGLTIDYHFTDWYDNDDLYIERALIYNSVSAFALIDNLENITFNFSGSSYSITREIIEENYPNYNNIYIDGAIDTERFNQHVGQKMNDSVFVSNIIKLFKID